MMDPPFSSSSSSFAGDEAGKKGREDPWKNAKNEISSTFETVARHVRIHVAHLPPLEFSAIFSFRSTRLSIPFHPSSRIYPSPFSFSPHLRGRGAPPWNTSYARADQSHLLRRGVTQHVTSVHLVRVPTASRCQPHRSRTGRDACPPIVYPNETKRSDRTGRRLHRAPSSPPPSQFRASTKARA